MIGSTTPLSTLETAAFAGNLDVVKQLVAMSNEKCIISGVTLVKLLDSKIRKMQEIAMYLMKNCHWSIYEMQQALIEMGIKKTFNQWLLEQKKSIYNLTEFEILLRNQHIDDDLRHSVREGDVDAFSQKWQHYARPSSYAAELLNYLPESVNNSLRRFYRDSDAEITSEYLTVQQEDYIRYHLDVLIYSVDVKNIAMLIKFVELGVDLDAFERHVGMPLQKWCEENFCQDLLEREDIKVRMGEYKKFKTIRDIIIKSASQKLSPKDEETLLLFAQEDGIELLTKAYFSTENSGLCSFYIWIANNNLGDLLAYPGILTSNIKSVDIHATVLESAQKGNVKSVDTLISYAKLNNPSALRFSKEEIQSIKDKNQTNLADKLAHSFEPLRPASLMWRGLSYVASSVVSLGGDLSVNMDIIKEHDEYSDNEFSAQLFTDSDNDNGRLKLLL